MPVLVVSARGDVAARVEALDLGADDYLATPFAMPEFEARVRALVRRGHQSNKELISFGSLTYDRSARGAFQNGEMLNLSSRETALMELLLSQPGKILTMERLAEHVRHLGDQVSHNAIQVYIHRLRRKVEACGVRILAVRGMGYRLEEDSSSIT
ncbi:Transcriptional regulatory protein tctD [compost metagenome]